MLYLTHSLYAVGFSLLFGPLLFLAGFDEVNYWLLLVVLAVFGKEGAKWPDCDHRNWNSVKEKTPFYRISNLIITSTGGNHRSRHTHSLVVCLFVLVSGDVGITLAGVAGMMKSVNVQMAIACLTGFCAGWLSHLFADSLNSAGIWFFPWDRKKFSLVGDGFTIPIVRKKIRFKTGGDWENLCQRVASSFNYIVIVLVVLFGLTIGGGVEWNSLLDKLQT